MVLKVDGELSCARKPVDHNPQPCSGVHVRERSRLKVLRSPSVYQSTAARHAAYKASQEIMFTTHGACAVRQTGRARASPSLFGGRSGIGGLAQNRSKGPLMVRVRVGRSSAASSC